MDGVSVASIVRELNEKLAGGRVDKIFQPERDEIVLSIRAKGGNHKLLLTAEAQAPRIHLTKAAKLNPAQAPLFCMVLRKHLTGGRIIGFEQPDFERIVSMQVESMSEMMDLSIKRLVVELMGKHSNIMLLGENGAVLDCVKRISADISSVRVMLPGVKYLPPPGGKANPLNFSSDEFAAVIEESGSIRIQEAIFKSFNGISPLMASEICEEADVMADNYAQMLTMEEKLRLREAFASLTGFIRQGSFRMGIYYDEKGKMKDFSSVSLSVYRGLEKKAFESPSEMIEEFYQEKAGAFRLAQKTADLRKILQNNIERCAKKANIYMKTLDEIKDREINKIKGELLTANIYSLKKGMTSFKAQNYYSEDGCEIDIDLNPLMTPSENAQRYYKKYNKQKRTLAALSDQIKANDEELSYLDGVLSGLSLAADESDIADIREELAQSGFIKKKRVGKGAKAQSRKKSSPLHFLSSDGFDIYVGKNNIQNDFLTMRFAQAGDLWLHAKDMPGSHVIISSNGKQPPEKTIYEAAHLAAYYSKGKNSTQVPVDYTLKRNVKKPNGAKPGYVIYEANKTAYITPDEKFVKEVKVAP
jgi:predicted ribosome quality control (RQC) complex YloA/Tae2 family protein